MNAHLIIIGASVRAAAMSACRAGYAPWAVDCFTDWDLTAVCDSYQIDDYPYGFPRFLGKLPPAPWMYVGGLENHPDIVDEISRDRLLLGNPGQVLRRVRDPHFVTEFLRKSGVSCPAVSRTADGVSTDGTWLCKPTKSAGGGGIQTYRGQSIHSKPVFFQQRVDGLSCSAVYVSDAKDVQLIGITEQLVGTHWPGILPFRYVGSIGPLDISGPLRAELTRVGSLLRNEFHLRGIFGVDAIIRDETVWIIEVNPRYTASVEILEQTLNVDSLTLHVSSCGGETISKDRLPKFKGKCGKAIYYAREPLAITEVDHQWMVRHHRENENFSQFADIPLPGSRISTHHPVCTVLASAPSHEEVRERLLEIVDRLHGRF